LAVVGNRYQGFVAKSLQPQGVFVKNLTGRSELDSLAGAVEESVAVFLFQLANLGADSRLLTKNFLAGAREAALPGNFQKSNQLIEIHYC